MGKSQLNIGWEHETIQLLLGRVLVHRGQSFQHHEWKRAIGIADFCLRGNSGSPVEQFGRTREMQPKRTNGLCHILKSRYY